MKTELLTEFEFTSSLGEVQDVIVVGGGFAGISVALFLKNAGLNVALVEKEYSLGKGLGEIESVSYPGFFNKSGKDLGTCVVGDAYSSGINIVFDEIVAIKKEKSGFCCSGQMENYSAKFVIIATGKSEKKLDGEFLGLKFKGAENGIIETNKNCQTSIKNIFAVGDIKSECADIVDCLMDAKFVVKALTNRK